MDREHRLDADDHSARPGQGDELLHRGARVGQVHQDEAAEDEIECATRQAGIAHVGLDELDVRRHPGAGELELRCGPVHAGHRTRGAHQLGEQGRHRAGAAAHVDGAHAGRQTGAAQHFARRGSERAREQVHPLDAGGAGPEGIVAARAHLASTVPLRRGCESV